MVNSSVADHASQLSLAADQLAGNSRVDVSVVMPCLNDRDTIGPCVDRALATLASHGLSGEVIVADNGSTDGSIAIAEGLGARVISEAERGYGAAYMTGIGAARGRYILMGDSDNTYDFSDLPRLIEPLRQGYDLVLGSRFRGTILPGSMPWANRYIGNPILTGLLNRLFKLQISDAHSGMRAFTREAYARMQLRTTGMEFASEMVIKASLTRLKITEVPITYHPRGGTSKLQPLGDAWRHIRFMLLFSPTYLFLLPGVLAMTVGLILTAVLVNGPIYLGRFYVGIHFMVIGSMLAILGQQMISFGVSARAFAFSEHLVERDRWLDRAMRYYSLERGLLAGSALAAVGLVTFIYILVAWLAGDVRFNQLIHLHQAIAASTLMIMGCQVIAASFFLSLLELHRPDPAPTGDAAIRREP